MMQERHFLVSLPYSKRKSNMNSNEFTITQADANVQRYITLSIINKRQYSLELNSLLTYMCVCLS